MVLGSEKKATLTGLKYQKRMRYRFYRPKFPLSHYGISWQGVFTLNNVHLGITKNLNQHK